MELLMQALEMDKAPLDGDGKKMTAAARNEWVQVTFDSESEALDDATRDDLRERILKATAAKKVAKQEAKDLRQSGGVDGGVTAGASFGVAVESTTVVR